MKVLKPMRFEQEVWDRVETLAGMGIVSTLEAHVAQKAVVVGLDIIEMPAYYKAKLSGVSDEKIKRAVARAIREIR